MIQIRRLITCDDIFMADLVLQYCVPNLSCKELIQKRDGTKKGSIIIYLIEPCYLFTSSSQTVCNTESAPLSWNVLTNLKGYGKDSRIFGKIYQKNLKTDSRIQQAEYGFRWRV